MARLTEKDFALRALAIMAYLFAFLFSITALEDHPEIIAMIWGMASLFYWWLAHEFEGRDHQWEKEKAREK